LSRASLRVEPQARGAPLFERREPLPSGSGRGRARLPGAGAGRRAGGHSPRGLRRIGAEMAGSRAGAGRGAGEAALKLLEINLATRPFRNNTLYWAGFGSASLV